MIYTYKNYVAFVNYKNDKAIVEICYYNNNTVVEKHILDRSNYKSDLKDIFDRINKECNL